MISVITRTARALWALRDQALHFDIFQMGDPFVGLVNISANKLGSFGTTIILWLFYFGVPAVLSMIEGTAVDNDLTFLSYFDDRFGILNYAFTYPLVPILLVRYYKSIEYAFAHIGERIILPGQVAEFLRFRERFGVQISRRWTLALPLILTAVVIFWYQDQFKAIGALKVYGGGGQGQLTSLGLYWFIAVDGTIMFSLFCFLIRHAIFIQNLRVFCRVFSLHLYPKDPDHCAGLSPLGMILIHVTWLATLAAIMVMSFIGLGASAGFGYTLLLIRVALTVPFYLIVIPLAIGYPLWIIHKAMQTKQETALKHVSDMLNLFVERVLQINPIELRNSGKEMRELANAEIHFSLVNSTYSVLEEMPTWPVNVRTLKTFTPALSLVISPIATSLAKAFLGV